MKKIRLFTKEWNKIRSSDNYVSMEECIDKPDVLLSAALHDIRQHDFGTWVLNQIYFYQSGMSVDSDTMGAEAFEWEFYDDKCKVIYSFNESVFFELSLEDFATAVRGIRYKGFAVEGVEVTFL